MVNPVDIKKASQSKADGRTEPGSPKKRSSKSFAKSSSLTGVNRSASQSKERRRKSCSKVSGHSKSTRNRKSQTETSWDCSSVAPEPESRPFMKPRCFFDLPKIRRTCRIPPNWQHCKYVRDDCGSGIVPKKYNLKSSHDRWCKTPLSTYQATIGELGRKLLCSEMLVKRNVAQPPPCNIEEYILQPCRGYYRRYDCLKPCEEEHTKIKDNKKIYRDRVERYWNPCLDKDEQLRIDVNKFAPHNAVLTERYRRINIDGELNIPCW